MPILTLKKNNKKFQFLTKKKHVCHEGFEPGTCNMEKYENSYLL